MWRAVWAPDGNGYSLCYATKEPSFLRLYRSTDPTRWEMLADKILLGHGDPNETGLIFRKDASSVCLVRVDGKTRTSMLGTSSPRYEKWEWKDLGVQIGGPALIELPDQRLVVGVRLAGPDRTSLCWLDVAQARLEEFLKLPSAGDTGYPGLVLFDGKLWVSYYSSHEGKAKIYLAEVAID